MRMNLIPSIGGLVRLFIPLECPVCGNVPFDGESGSFCADCLRHFDFVPEPSCPGCGGVMDGILGMCPVCLRSAADRPWQDAFSLFRMNGFGRDLIHQFKYENRPELACPLARLTAQRLGGRIRNAGFDWIVPVPLHWSRFLSRGYNQSEVFARCVGAELGIPVTDALRRVRRTDKQASLSQKQRIANLKDAFRINHSTKPEKRAILLVDDVMTTGSTLASAARTLRRAGAGRIGILILARR